MNYIFVSYTQPKDDIDLQLHEEPYIVQLFMKKGQFTDETMPIQLG